ncbi:hypothetical protein LSTR_LSTR005930 [Laodelphax striatellus]|uniref:Lipase domain-containing protein n=1 Tax=Laodelphax striatellus TaxID=195883 RepID=A0A482WGW0_LAOST|nr:hypothetical protein LSTR_LSTR005930 [Laodelphax striatellus]
MLSIVGEDAEGEWEGEEGGREGYGMSEPCGHVDFYPNNGREQPGCDITETPLPLTFIREGIEEASRVLVACNHVRAIKLFTESINSRCPYVAHRCSNYNHFLQGRCFSCGDNGSGCAMMGLDVQRSSHPPGSKYFIATGRDSPYCRRHYRVTLDLARPPRAEAWVQGFMRVGYERFEHGTSRSFVVTHPEEVGEVRRVELYWEYDMDVLQPRSLCFLWCNDHLYVASVHVAMATTPHGANAARDKRAIEVNTKLCSSGNRDYADVPSRSSVVFVDSCTSAKRTISDELQLTSSSQHTSQHSISISQQRQEQQEQIQQQQQNSIQQTPLLL